jgi:hypothetical protein
MNLHPCLRDGRREYVVLPLHEPLPEGHEWVATGGGWTLERQLLQLAREDANLRTLRALVYAHGHRMAGGLAPLTAEQVSRQAAALLASGLLRLARAPLPGPYVAPPFTEVPVVAPPVAAEEPAWLRLQVVDDVSDAPISGLELRIQLEDRSEKRATTDPEGRIDLKDVPRGSANVLSVIDGATLDDTLALVRTGGPWSKQKPAKAGQKGKARPTPRFLARVTEHRVIDGETLESVAEMYGLTVDALTRFNWDTTDPAEIQRHLLIRVGCTFKDKRGRFIFTRQDDPGILYVPRPEAVPRLPVEQSHILRVKRVPEPRPFLFSL